MTRAKLKELEELLLGIDVLVLEVENAKEKTPLTSHESIKIANDFAALKQSALRWIRHYINANTSEVEKHLLQEIAAGLKNLDSVNTQYAPAIMAALIRKLRRF